MSQVEIKVPDIGDAKDVEVIEVMVAVGDTIEAEQSLITLESDKSSMEIPASQGGVVKSIKVKVGDKVSEGAIILTVEAADASDAQDKPASDAGRDKGDAAKKADAAAGSADKPAAPAKDTMPAATQGGSQTAGSPARAPVNAPQAATF